jgi:hypothetical protein
VLYPKDPLDPHPSKARRAQRPRGGHATAIVRQVLAKSTVSGSCHSAKSSYPFTRAELADLDAIR